VKFTMAKVLREVSFNSLHIHGSLGTTDLTPLQAMYASAPTMGIADGVDEVHIATVARNILKDYRPHEGYFPTEFFPRKREAAWKRFEPQFEADPELRQLGRSPAGSTSNDGGTELCPCFNPGARTAIGCLAAVLGVADVLLYWAVPSVMERWA
jgi:hypothetical protein